MQTEDAVQEDADPAPRFWSRLRGTHFTHAMLQARGMCTNDKNNRTVRTPGFIGVATYQGEGPVRVYRRRHP